MWLLLLVWGLLPVGCEPISEAQRLYCGQCLAECQQLPQGGGRHVPARSIETATTTTTTGTTLAGKQPDSDAHAAEIGPQHHAEPTRKPHRDQDNREAENNGKSVEAEDDNLQLEQQETYLSDALSSLKCTCRTVFDLKRRTLVCKNTSSAQLLAKTKQQSLPGGQLDGRLEAISRSASGSRIARKWD